MRPALGYCLVGTAAVAITVDLFYLAYSLLDGMVHLLLFLILLRLFVRRGLRDLRDAALLSFFMLVAAASISFSLSFLAVFVVFLVLGTWMLILNHVVTELEQAGREGAAGSSTRRVFFRGPLTRVSLVAAAITFVARGRALLHHSPGGPGGLAAAGPARPHGDRLLGPGGPGELRRHRERPERGDARVPHRRAGGAGRAARAALAGRGLRPVRRQRLVERGATRRYIRRGAAATSGSACCAATGPVLRQEIYLEPIGTDAVFGAPRMLRLECQSPTVVVDDMGGLTAASATARLHYIVESELEPTRPRRARGRGRRRA